jgi:NADH pyrophosphatase NudC (nudix superfamily)
MTRFRTLPKPTPSAAVYEARIVSGSSAPSDGELSDVAWFTPEELATLELSRFASALLHATDHL